MISKKKKNQIIKYLFLKLRINILYLMVKGCEFTFFNKS